MNPQTLQTSIQSKLSNYDLEKEYSYDEILFILDEQVSSGKCDRDTARELFEQSVNPTNKATLNEMIFKYVENLEISRLCLLREQKAEEIIHNKLDSLKGSKKTYVYLKIIQATVYARHSPTPSFSYKIWPSDIPAVTVVNSLNPILNHEYTLELESEYFSILFYESGVQIGEWKWPDGPNSNKEGEYQRSVMTESISFELKINYKPINSNPNRKALEENLTQVRNKRQIETEASSKLQNFEPFLLGNTKPPKSKVSSNKNSNSWALSEKLFVCMPFLKNHVNILYFCLLALIIVECLASIIWPMEFLDIAVAFGIIGVLYDRVEFDVGMEMLVTVVGCVILIIKSIWGMIMTDEHPFYWTIFLILAIVIKLVCIFMAWIVSIRKEEVPVQREIEFYGEMGANKNRSNLLGVKENFDYYS